MDLSISKNLSGSTEEVCLRAKIITAAVLILGFAALLHSQEGPADTATKAKSVADYYKKQVKGIYLKDRDELISGQILAFRNKGIIFKRTKQGPLYNPKAEYIPISKLQAFVDGAGKALWGQIPVTEKYDFLQIRKYKAKIGLAYGFGQHPNSYTFSPLVPDVQDYIQNLFGGTNIIGEAGLFLSPRYNVGLKYVRHTTKAEIYSLKADADPATINDDITIQNFMFQVGFHQSASRMVIFQANAAIGGLFYNNQRQIDSETLDITGTSFSAILGGGVDFLLSRNVALGFELAYLMGGVKDPQVSGDTGVIEGKQRLNRFDINAGVRFYF